MAGQKRVVTTKSRTATRMPDWTGEGVAIVTHLVGGGLLEQVALRLRIVRNGGYAGVDIVLHLLFYFMSGTWEGLKRFDGRVAQIRTRLAAVGGRRSLPTQASVSRLLSAATPDAVRDFGRWALRELAEVAILLQHPSVQTCDALGRLWHEFDYDPTKTVLRQRALPEGDDLPPGLRRADAFAAPGYSGRKRGEVQISRSALQHAGSGVWLDSRVEAGNGESRAQLGSALGAVVEVCEKLNHPLNRAVVRLDGEFGNVPSLTALREAGVCGITRLNRPALLDQEGVRRHMANNEWYVVPDSRSGPQRSAMDLGTVTVAPGQATLRDDGTAYEPIDVRVVVSRYPREKEAEHGRVIDGWQYELFVALDLDAAGWPAPDVVAAYFSRSGQENRFAQEDRELGLDRIFSYTLAGQELACIIGLLVWNLRVVHGFRLNPLPEERAEALPRRMEIDPRPVPEGFVEEVAMPDVPSEPPEQVAIVPDDPHIGLARLLLRADWDRFHRRLPDWKAEPDRCAIRCPNQQQIELMCVAKNVTSVSHSLFFQGAPKICRDCPRRASCIVSADVNKPKCVALSVPKPLGHQVAQQLSKVRHARRVERANAVRSRPLPSGRPRPINAKPVAFRTQEGQRKPGEWQYSGSQFSPTAARRAFQDACACISVHITVGIPPKTPPHPYLVTTPAQRQHRRLTWDEHNARYALPDDAQLRVALGECGQIETVLHLAA